MKSLLKTNLFYFVIVLTICSCKKDPRFFDASASGYPVEVAEIVLAKCAVEGCHNSISKDAAAGLDLTSWESLFKGTRNGVAVIPFWHKQSTMFLFCNTYNDLGVTLLPTMPIAGNPLSRNEVLTIRNWIDKGAPNNKNFVKFSDNPKRKKFYVPNQGCDLVTVFDQETGLPMRYVSTGNSAATEAPHQIRVSPDKRHWYVISTQGNSLQKFDATNDNYIGEIVIDYANWNTFVITSDSKYAFVVDWSSNGKVFVLDLENLKILIKYPLNFFVYPHGVALSNDNKKLYVASQFGNFLYKLTFEAPYSYTNPNFDNLKISLDGNPPNNSFSLDPHDIVFTNDGSNCLITCQRSNELRILNTSTEQIVAVVPTGIFPQEVVFDYKRNHAYVSCPEDTIAFPGKRGCISVIDLNTNTLIKNIYSGHQPHGIAIDFDKNELIVANRNVSSDGPAPHHSSDCGGRNGYVTFIDLKTLETIKGRKIEISVDPYFVAIRE